MGTMNKPKLLDLFCGAGGCAMGYYQAGFEVVGVDLVNQPHYPFEFHQADALTFPLEGFDVIHASPPCQAFTKQLKNHPEQRIKHHDLLTPTRKRLLKSSKPWIIENVIGAPVHHGVMLCGSMFALGVYRHRWFETSILMFAPGACQHNSKGCIGVYGDHVRDSSRPGAIRKDTGRPRPTDVTFEVGCQAMGIDWMTRQYELSQAIPPAYTKWIGQFLLDAVQAERVAS